MTNADIIAAVLRREGVYDDNPADPGGETAFGISKRYHPEAWVNGPPTREQAIAIYEHDYLLPFAELEPIELRAQVVDIAVNCGVSTAHLLLGKAMLHPERPVAVQLVIERLKYYVRKVKATPKKLEFLMGWVNRSVEFL